MTAGTNTLGFVPKSMVPKRKTVTYGRLVCDIKQNKKETHYTRLTVGGNLINFNGDKSTTTANLTTIKALFTSNISTLSARCCTADIKNFYLSTLLAEFEYMKLKLDIIPDKITQQYKLLDITVDGWIYCEIKKGYVWSLTCRQNYKRTVDATFEAIRLHSIKFYTWNVETYHKINNIHPYC